MLRNANVVQRIIGGKRVKGPARKSVASTLQLLPQAEASGSALGARGPAVRWLSVDEGSQGQRLDNYLIKLLKGVPKTHVYRVIRSGEVRVNKGRAAADTRLALGDQVRLPPVRISPPAKSKTVLYAPCDFALVWEDECFIAIDKPTGMAVHGGSGVHFGVIEQLRLARPKAKFLELVHRLDKDTSGLLLIAKKRSALLALQEQWRMRAIGKTYAALVSGAWPRSRKVIDVPLHKYLNAKGERHVRAVTENDVDGRRSITLVQVVDSWPEFTLLDVVIRTGRTHQIRVHLMHEGHPVVGDPKYGDFALNKALARGEIIPGHRWDRMFLHARKLRFAHPASHEPIELEAPLPSECATLLAALTLA